MSEPPADPESDAARAAHGSESPEVFEDEAFEDEGAFEDEAFEDEGVFEDEGAAAGGLLKKPFLEHLSDLRVTLIKIVVVFFVFAIICAASLGHIFDLLRVPLRALAETEGADPNTIGLLTLGPQEGFVALMMTAFSGALVLSMPFTLYFVGQFLLPGLTRRERGLLLPAFVAGTVLFLSGVVFAFFVTLPLVLRLLWRLYEQVGLENMWTVRMYLSFVTKFMLANGLIFELPLVLIILVRLGVVTVGQLSKRRRHAIMIILVASACLTPPDAASMFLVAGPMYLLYEASIVVSVLLERRRRRRAQ